MKKKKRFSIRLLIYNVLITSIILAIVFCVFLAYYMKNQIETNENEINLSMERSNADVESVIAELDSVALQVSLNSNIIHTMERAIEESDDYYETHITELSKVNETLWSYIMDPKKITMISVYNENGDIVSASANEETEEFSKVIDKEWIQYLKAQFRKPGVYELYVNRTEKHGTTTYQGISVVREIKGMDYSKQCVGYVETTLGIEQIEDELRDSVIDDVVILYDTSTNKVMGSTITGSSANTTLDYQDYIERSNFKNCNIKKQEIPEKNIGIIVLQSKEEMIRFVKASVLFALGIYLICLFLIILIQQKVSLVLTEPLVRLCSSVEYRSADDSKKGISLDEGVVEIDTLSMAFSEIMERIDVSMKNEINAKTEHIKTQLYALRAQMNPHFIHNTIAIIQSYAIEEDYDKILDVCENLSDFIRYSSNLSVSKVPLMDEMNNVRRYMNILNLKYGENLIFEQKIKGDIRKIEIPYFILQPIIENAVKHGLTKKEFPWIISVECEGDNKNWLVKIKDNGIGISEDRIKEIMKYKERIFDTKEDVGILKETWEIGGLSLRNIILRLYLEYGEKMIFEIDSEEGNYTTIVMGGEESDTCISG